MAKTIKFNLILDGYAVRNLEGVREHFSIEDILNYFENGLLLRWLHVRGYDQQYNAVHAIDKSLGKKQIIISLVKIFEVVDVSDADIEKAISILTYTEEKKVLNAIYRDTNFERQRILDDYHAGYDALINHMEDNKENMALLKADAIEMEKTYLRLFWLDNFDLYSRLIESAPKAIFAILTRDTLKAFWIGQGANPHIYQNIKENLLEPSKAEEILGDDLKIVNKNTEAMWDDIETAEVQLIVISIERGSFVRNFGSYKEKLSNSDVNYEFLKFKGLQYQCNNERCKLLYMEV